MIGVKIMEDKTEQIPTKKSGAYGIIAGVIFALMILFSVFGYIDALFADPSVFWSIFLKNYLILYLAYLCVAVALFRQKHDLFPVIGFAILALRSIVSLRVPSPANLLNLLWSVAILFVVAAVCTNFLPQCRKVAQKCWFVPAVIAFIKFFFLFISILLQNAKGEFITHINLIWILNQLLPACGLLFTGLWAVPLQKKPKKTYYPVPNGGSAPAAAAVLEHTGYCGLAKHVLLLLFTFGIWNLIWTYRTTGWLNQVEDEPPRNPTTKLLLCMFVPFYSIYWIYKSAQRIDKLAAAKGVRSDISTICLILAIFVGIIPPILMQDKINAIITANSAAI